MPAVYTAHTLLLIQPCGNPTPETRGGEQLNSHEASGYGSQRGGTAPTTTPLAGSPRPKGDEHRHGPCEMHTRPDTSLQGRAALLRLSQPNRLHFNTL
ncbi:hypothetical protein NDU88_001471 [Pleurodeles waltl]|uniref:Uncharacterized protein n=1 Tax=Pleurodeles waltl TaxID=8319 RepID=A0AAV7VZB1_PLEWA|nr:hypothetical protein NDU88_001471 [Pleurodeles waltl]